MARFLQKYPLGTFLTFSIIEIFFFGFAFCYQYQHFCAIFDIWRRILTSKQLRIITFKKII